jgi:glycosyltransferase involved in cell wall biosynthesis
MNILAYVHLRNIYRSTGVGRVARELTEHLARRPGVQLQVLADPADHHAVIDKVGPPWNQFPYHFLPHETSLQQALWILGNRPSAETFWPEVDVVYCTAESFVPVRRARLAVASHDMQIFEPGAHRPSRWLLQQRFKWRIMFARLAQQADLFHAISHFSADRMAHFFPAIRSRIRVVPNAVSSSFFLPPTAAGNQILAKLRIADRPYLLVPGGLHHRKNADLILSAWPRIHRQCPELQLVIINHNDPAYIARAEALGPSVLLAGFQEEAHIVALYSSAQAVWFPSRYEGFGMPVLEAMACGAPLVSSSASAIPEVAGGAAAALVSPDSPDQHVDALIGLMENTAAREQARTLGRERAAQFTWFRSANLLGNEFQALL